MNILNFTLNNYNNYNIYSSICQYVINFDIFTINKIERNITGST